MKRAKIMLTAIAMLAIVGGAVAFKAQRSAQVFRVGVGNLCTIPVNNYTTLQIPNVRTFVGQYTDVFDGICEETTVYFLQ
jgi:hypothetical protein